MIRVFLGVGGIAALAASLVLVTTLFAGADKASAVGTAVAATCCAVEHAAEPASMQGDCCAADCCSDTCCGVDCADKGCCGDACCATDCCSDACCSDCGVACDADCDCCCSGACAG